MVSPHHYRSKMNKIEIKELIYHENLKRQCETHFCCWQEQENCGIFFEQNIVTFFNETGICLEHEFHNRVPSTICNALANRNASKELNPSKQVLGLQICDWPTRCKLLETPYWEMPVSRIQMLISFWDEYSISGSSSDQICLTLSGLST